MDLGLAGKTVFVMAGTRGIGLATARAYAGEGANVLLCGRSPAGVAEAARLLPDALCLTGDVTDAADMARIIDAGKERFGQIDILVVNAGGPRAGAYADLADADWADAVEVTLMSAVRTAQLVLPDMRARHWGRIVIISSYGVKQPVPGLGLSNSLRMAVLGWAKSLAREVAADGVTVNTVCPGWTRTSRVEQLLKTPEDHDRVISAIPLRRLGEPEDIARLATFLGSDAASYMTGTAIAVDGGIIEGYA